MSSSGIPSELSRETNVILPQRSRLEPFGSLKLVVLKERLHGQLRQPKDTPTLPRLGIAGDPRCSVDRDGADVEVNLAPQKRPEFLRSSSLSSPTALPRHVNAEERGIVCVNGARGL
jgi:hypothetical protein